MVYIDPFWQRDLAKNSTLAELAEMYGPMRIAMLMGGLSLYNQRIRERRDPDVFSVESRQSKLKLKGPIAFREFHVGDTEYFFFRLQPVANLVARSFAAPFEQLERTRPHTVQQLNRFRQKRTRLIRRVDLLNCYTAHFLAPFELFTVMLRNCSSVIRHLLCGWVSATPIAGYRIKIRRR